MSLEKQIRWVLTYVKKKIPVYAKIPYPISIRHRKMVRIVSVNAGEWKVYVTIGFSRNHILDKPATCFCRVNLYL